MDDIISDRTQTDANWVTFERRSVRNNYASEQAGHPIFEDRDYVIIQPPGRQDLRIETPVTAEHRARYPRLWANYEAHMRGAAASSGTPIAEWPAVTRAQADTLRGLQFHTVEQIAGASDLQVQSLQLVMPAAREKARAYLEAASGSATIEREKLAREKTQAENLELRAQLQEMQRQIDALVNERASRRPRGRPRKYAEGA